MVSLTPGTAFLWAELHVSHYTYRDDGGRDLGHLAKAVSVWPGIAVAVGVMVLMLGFGAIALARRGARDLTAQRLVSAAVGVAALIGLLASGSVVLLSSGSAKMDAVSSLGTILCVVLACALAAGLLGFEFIAVAALPFQGTTPSRIPGRLARAMDRLVLLSACAATCAALVWIGQLIAYSIQHPCNCG
jgi:hypothetical protein